MRPLRHMRWRRGLRLLSVAVALVVVVSPIAEAMNLRGRVDGYNPYMSGFAPVGGIVVTLFQQQGPTWVPVSQSMTNMYGFYYFYGVPVGSYRVGPTLQNARPVSVIPANAAANQDVPIIQMR